MSIPSKELRAKLAKLLPELQQLHARQDEIITERICDVAEEISGVPIGVLRDLLGARSVCFCRCQAIKKIASGDDGL
jgi:hypothetical protein